MNQEAKVGAFTVTGVVLLAAFLIGLSNFHLFGSRNYSLNVGFTEVIGLNPSAEVRFAGVPVGRVNSVETDGIGAVVKIEIKPDIKVPRGSKFSVGSSGFLSEKYILISPVEDRGDYLKDGEYVYGITEVTMDSMMANMNMVVNKVHDLMDSVNKVLGNPNLQSSMVETAINVRDITANMRDITASFARISANNENEINQLANTIRNIRNNTTYNDINIFGDAGVANTYDIEKLSAEQAIEQGYTIISTAEDLKNISGSGKYILMNDIDLAGSNLGVKNLTGTFDGNGYTISNLTITTEDTGVKGLFTTSTGTIKNVTLTNVNIDTNENYVGGLVGTGKTIINCVVTGTIHSTQGTIGGMIGKLEGSATNVLADVDITSSGSHIGGLVGNMAWGPVITNGAAKGDVKGYNQVGGLVGSIQCGKINNSYATGNVTATNAYAAGLIGYLNGSGGDTVIKNSYATGDVKAKGSVFGFAGYVNPTSSNGVYGGIYTNCYSTGNVIATSASNDAVGFASMAGDNTHFTNCFSTGTVKAGKNGNSYAFSGNNSDKVTNCYVIDSTGATVTNSAATEMSAEWFQSTSNLTFLGENFNFNGDHPQILTNMEIVPKPSEVTIQIGANDGDDNRMSLDLSFTLPTTAFNVSTAERANESLATVDNLLNEISLQRTKAGYKSAMLDDIMSSQTVRAQNYESSISTIMDTDYAKEMSNFLRNQILQEVTSSLISQANLSQSLALSLLNNNFLDFNNPKRNLNLSMIKNNYR